jgi:hypothetical protein
MDLMVLTEEFVFRSLTVDCLPSFTFLSKFTFTMQIIIENFLNFATLDK